MYKHAKITIFDDLLAGDFFFHAKGCNLKFPGVDSFSFLVEKMQNCLEWQRSPIAFFFPLLVQKRNVSLTHLLESEQSPRRPTQRLEDKCPYGVCIHSLQSW